ncbi:hypothetical protein F383_17739 [Gossypium arboreum]|uniref:Uncharacterized protein n=1 Tax=Gossypium arboreum TaxID=29729 RepID=A0A0B0NDG4_GOSAR|nr:hypothetical protein F383_17739 [Gossypium arboreum]
MANLIFSR